MSSEFLHEAHSRKKSSAAFRMWAFLPHLGQVVSIGVFSVQSMPPSEEWLELT